MEQTVAEAVAAATQQQQQAAQQAQQLISQPSPPVQPVTNASSTIDNLTCQWQGCGERCDSAEALYVGISLSLSSQLQSRASCKPCAQPAFDVANADVPPSATSTLADPTPGPRV